MELTPRLALAAQLAAGGTVIADVGCDHAYLSIYLARQDPACRLLASDLREGPLQRAKENITAAGLMERISLALADGLRAVPENGADTVVICGMGGEVMCEILTAAPWLIPQGARLVLQPMTRAEVLRPWLQQNGWRIEKECFAREGHRLYTVLLAVPGESSVENNGLFSEAAKADPLFPEYKGALLDRYRAVREGQRRGNQPTEETDAILKILEER